MLIKDKDIASPGGYSGFQVTGMIEGFFRVFEIFDSGIFLGMKIWLG